MSGNVSMEYGYDALCGWCYGFLPTLRGFQKQYPNVPIEVVPYGLFTGDKAKPYSHLVPHIRKNEVRLEKVTGLKPSDVFHEMIAGESPPLSESACPSEAILQMQALAPEHTLELSHILLEAHFKDGKDLNLPETYDDICAAHGFPKLDTEKIAAATCTTPSVAASFERAASLDIRPLPTMVVKGPDGTILGRIREVFSVEEFNAAFDALSKQSTEEHPNSRPPTPSSA